MLDSLTVKLKETFGGFSKVLFEVAEVLYLLCA